MDFYIKKGATLPILKLSVVKDGRNDFHSFMKTIELSAIFFSMVDIETGVPKISSRPAGFVEKTFIEPNAEPEYYIYYQFQNRDTNRVGRYEGQFMLRSSEGVLILPIREKLFINVQESFIADDLPYDSCYVSEFPCCVNGPYTTTTTTVPCPSCPTCPEPTPTPVTTTTTTFNPTTTTTTTIQQLINPVITENDEYIEVGENEYLMFVDPEIEYTISTEISSGSVVTTFTVNSNFAINYNVTIPLTVKLGLIGGGTIDVVTNVIMLPNQVVGQAIVTNPSLDYNSLNKTAELFVGDISPNDFPISVLATQIQFEVPPTPTPTPTNTQTPTPTPTPTVTPTMSGIVLNNYMMTRCFGLGVDSGVMPIPNQSATYKTSDNKCWYPIAPSFDTPTLVYTDIYLDCTACINSLPTPTPTPTPTITPTSSPIPQVDLTLYIQNSFGGQSIIFDGNTYNSDTTLTINKNQFYNIEAVPQPGYIFVGWNIFGGSFSSTGQSTTVSVSLDLGANLAPSYTTIPISSTPTPTPTPTLTPNCVRNIVIPSLWNGGTSINSNSLQLTQTPETLQIQVNDVITDFNGSTSIVGLIFSDGTYTYVGTGPGGTIAFNCQFPLTFSGPC